MISLDVFRSALFDLNCFWGKIFSIIAQNSSILLFLQWDLMRTVYAFQTFHHSASFTGWMASFRGSDIWTSHLESNHSRIATFKNPIIHALHVSLNAILIMGILVVYRMGIRPSLLGSCRFHPTCSAYAIQALQQHGLIPAIILIVWRIVRCHPWGQCGYDPVPSSLFSSS